MISQAIILAGGQGMRLRPLTNDAPKPMVDVNGYPFISYLIDQLFGEGIERILILAGYKADAFDAITDKHVQVVKGDEDWMPGQRLWEARELIDQRALVCYGDTYVPDFNLARASRVHTEQLSTVPAFMNDNPLPIDQPLVTLGAVHKRPGNVHIELDGVARYYLSPSPTLTQTDVGYMIVEREAIRDWTDLPVVLQELGFAGRLRSYPVETQLTIDTLELLAETAKLLAT